MPATIDIDIDKLAEITGGRAFKEDDYVIVEWSDSARMRVKLVVETGNVYFADLTAPESGTLTKLAGVLPGFYRDYGFTTFEAFAPKGKAWALAVGFEATECSDVYTASIDEGCRFDQYAAWKRGETPEPDWHSA